MSTAFRPPATVPVEHRPGAPEPLDSIQSNRHSTTPAVGGPESGRRADAEPCLASTAPSDQAERRKAGTEQGKAAGFGDLARRLFAAR